MDSYKRRLAGIAAGYLLAAACTGAYILYEKRQRTDEIQAITELREALSMTPLEWTQIYKH